jgi:protein-L-isoaspartate(D-aspartate) O-methyltransferase
LSTKLARSFTTAGMRLVSVALKGRATRILRAILIHHFLFHQNRLGLPYSEPVIIATAATKAVFDG